jgi:hypothetical protein
MSADREQLEREFSIQGDESQVGTVWHRAVHHRHSRAVTVAVFQQAVAASTNKRRQSMRQKHFDDDNLDRALVLIWIPLRKFFRILRLNRLFSWIVRTTKIYVVFAWIMGLKELLWPSCGSDQKPKAMSE